MIDAELRSITTLLTGLETFSVYDITRVDMVYKNIGDIRDHFELPHIMQFIREDMLTKDGFFIEHAKPPVTSAQASAPASSSSGIYAKTFVPISGIERATEWTK